MLLGKEQARSIYDAMCALNNIGATLNVLAVPNAHEADVKVHERLINGQIVIWNGDREETYANQNEFAAAYGVN